MEEIKDKSELDVKKIQELWKFLPKDYSKKVADHFGCSAGMAKYVRDLKDPDMTKMRTKTRSMMLFMAKLAKTNKDEVDEINKLAS